MAPGFTIQDARRWATDHSDSDADFRVGKLKRAARQLPREALPLMVDLLAEAGEEAIGAFAALHFNGAQVESDATDQSDPTWYRVTLPDGIVITRAAGGGPDQY